jgi:hypothetical protein
MKTNKIKPTELQKKAADEIIRQKVEKGRVNQGEALARAGYSESMQKTPSAVTESRGFLAYMEQAGITEQNLAVMLAEDLNAKPGERLGEMKLAAQLMGLDGAKDGSTNVQVNVALEKMRNIIEGEVDDEDEE